MNMNNMFDMHRGAIEMLYLDLCSIYEYQNVKDPKTSISRKEEVLIQENLPCKLSYSSIDAAAVGDGAAQRNMIAKLFIAPEIEVKPGSKLVVMHNGISTTFANSGDPGIYTDHKEIMLKLFERWA